MTLMAQHVSDLHDLLIAHPEGVTVSQMRRALGIAHVGKVIHKFRLDFARDKINLTANPTGSLGEWLYSLDAKSEAWAENRVGDAESRLETMTAMMQSVVHATSGRTLVGRKARKMEIAFRHLQEDLNEIAAEFAVVNSR